MKDKKTIIKQPLVNISDIGVLLNLSRKEAKRLYEICDEIEQKKTFRAHPTKVPLQLVLKKAHLTYAFLSKQIERT